MLSNIVLIITLILLIIILVLLYFFSNDIRKNKFDIINRKGNTVKQQIFGSSDYGSGLNALNIDNGKLIFACRDSIMLIDKVGNYSTIPRAVIFDYVMYNGDTTKENRNGFCPLIANNIFIYKGMKSALVLNQSDYSNINEGFVEIISIDQGKVLERKYRLLSHAYNIFLYGIIISVILFSIFSLL
jgi:hypothetical protein